MSSRDRYRVDFPALMRQCEENYARLLPLMRALGERDDMRVDTGQAQSHLLTLRVLERAPYTTTLRLEDQVVADALPATSLTVRLYHDARLAEVTQAQPFKRVVDARYGYPNRHMHQRDEKAQWNRLLGEWLAHVQHHGRATAANW